MTPFYTRLPELAARETRSVHVLVPGGPLPIGEYGFIEHYCEEDDCDCRRVLLQVTTPLAPHVVLATINFGWESAEFYTRWMHGDEEAGREITAASLDPLNPQSEYAEHLLHLFQERLMTDADYVARLARHYQLFKQNQGTNRDAAAAANVPARPNLEGAAATLHGGDPEVLSPGFETLDELMQEGYTLSEAGSPAKACDVWLQAWDVFVRLYAQGRFASLRAFDERFRGLQFLSNWVNDLDIELHNAGLKDPAYFKSRIRYCEDLLARVGNLDELTRENMRRAVAESWSELGQRGRSDALFEQWLKADPGWGWGWIGWGDTYYFSKPPAQDLPRAAQLLRQGLAVEGVRDADAILERLADVAQDLGQTEEATALRVRLRALRSAPEPRSAFVPFREAASAPPWRPSAPASARPKIGRNDPCPCGGGKKYKKCCGRN